MTSRVGLGVDVHPVTDDPARPLVLGGVRFDDAPGLAGHSDADVVSHAAADALLGAAGLGDLGSLFPDSDPALAGADSLRLLTEVAAKVRAAHASEAEASDDAALVEAAGGRVVVVPGAPAAAKVTAPSDLPALEAELS